MSAPRTVIGAAVATLIGSQLVAAPALAKQEPRDVTYLARVDGVAPGSRVAFQVSDTETSTVELDAADLAPGQPFEAHAALADLSRAGMRVMIPSPYSANATCQISVDGTVISRFDRLVAPPPGDGEPTDGVLSCGAAITVAAATRAS